MKSCLLYGALLCGVLVLQKPRVSAQPAKPAKPSGQPRQAKQGKKTAPSPEELRTSVARRIRQLTGKDARIGELRYEIFGSRFVGSDLEVGPRKEPLLSIGDLTVELSLLSGGGRNIQKVDAAKVRARLPASWLEKAISPRPHEAAHVRVGKAAGELHLSGDDGVATLIGVELGVRDLELPATNEDEPFRATGLLSLRSRRLTLGRLALERVLLEGKLQNDKLLIQRLEAELLGGKLQLRGRLGLAGARPGPLELRGTLSLRLTQGAAPLEGKVRLFGRNLALLRLEGKLSGPSPERQSGAVKPSPNVRVRLRLGGRELRGTAAAWEIK